MRFSLTLVLVYANYLIGIALAKSTVKKRMVLSLPKLNLGSVGDNLGQNEKITNVASLFQTKATIKVKREETIKIEHNLNNIPITLDAESSDVAQIQQTTVQKEQSQQPQAQTQANQPIDMSQVQPSETDDTVSVDNANVVITQSRIFNGMLNGVIIENI